MRGHDRCRAVGLDKGPEKYGRRLYHRMLETLDILVLVRPAVVLNTPRISLQSLEKPHCGRRLRIDERALGECDICGKDSQENQSKNSSHACAPQPMRPLARCASVT